MRNVYIIGVDTLRFGKYLNRDHSDLVTESLTGALTDARISIKDIQSVNFANSLWGYYNGQDCIRGQIAMRHSKVYDIPVTNLEGGCAGGTMALHFAWKDILTGLYDCSLAIGVEKLYMEDKKKMFAAFDGGIDVLNRDVFFQEWEKVKTIGDVPLPEAPPKKDRSVFMDIYAIKALWHMSRYGTTQKQLAIIAAKNHQNGSLNKKAQFQFNMTVEQVLNDYTVSYPLTRSMCAPLGDGAATAIVCSEEYLRHLPVETQKRAIKILASVLVSGRDFSVDELSDDVRLFGCSVRAAKKAYEMAALGPKDLSLVEVHDAAASGELFQYENLGLCPVGEGGRFAESGATKLGGTIPVNPSGGLISRGHPIAASGLAQIYELVTQLRGEAMERQVLGAKIALGENGGGVIGFEEAACCVNILQAPV